jgi:diguanylate cyclase (GGDEF)-like protein/PAS domain S-box-containing protein
VNVKRFVWLPATKFLFLYSLAIITLPISYVIVKNDASLYWFIPVALFLLLIFRQFFNSGRKHVEEQFTKMDKALQTTQLGITITDNEGRILYINSAEARMHGYQPEELLGKSVRIFAPPEIWELNPPDMIREMQSWLRESENLRKDGSSFPVHLVSDVIRNSSGEPIGIVTVSEDITERKKAEIDLRNSESKFRSVAESATDALVLSDEEGRIIFWNSAAQRIFGYEQHEVMGEPLTMLMPRRYQDAHRVALKRRSEEDSPKSVGKVFEFHGLKKSGEEFSLELSLGSWTTPKGSFYSAIIRDISDRKRVEEELHRHREQLEDLVRHRTAELAEANRMLTEEIDERRLIEAALRKSEERYELAVRGSMEGLWDWNLKTNEIFYSIPWKTMIGYHDHEITSRPEEWLNRVHPDDLLQMNNDLALHVEGRTEHFESEHRILQKDGEYRWVLTKGAAIRDEKGNAIRVAGIMRDIQARKILEADWKHRAFRDPLTDLPNRAHFMERLNQAIHRTVRQPDLFTAVLYVDLDFFKQINDKYGHRVGDQLLMAVASKLKSCLRPSDTIARIGGDEFTILLEDIKNTQEAVRIAERICTEIREPFMIDQICIQTSASIGIAVSRPDSNSGEGLLNDADLAMYLAKDQGRARHEVFGDRLS